MMTTIDEPSDFQARQRLYAELAQALSPVSADFLMNALPPVPMRELATREDLDSRIASVRAEIKEGQSDLKTELSELGTELRTEMSELGTELRTEMSELRAELKTEMSELRTELKTEMSELRTELRTDMSELRTELRTDMSELRTELKTDMAVEFGRLHESIGELQRTIGFDSRRQAIMIIGLMVALFSINLSVTIALG